MGIYDLRKIFIETFLYNKVVVEQQQFQTFLESLDLSLSYKDILEITCLYILESDSSDKSNLFIDLEAFEEDIYDKNALHQHLGYSPRQSYISLQVVYDELRKYIMSTNGNVY